MKVLILNWRDIRSPGAGGAERVTHEVARHLVRRGHAVTWLSSAAPGLPADEQVDGVSVVRRGSELTTRLRAPGLARQIAPDVVLEEINTLPYLAPVWSKAPVLLYMNQLARNVWWYEAPKPLAPIGWSLEPVYLRAYSRCNAVTISPSSRDDLRRFGIRGEIIVTPLAVDVERAPELEPRRRVGAMVAIGRLAPSKRYDDAVRALAELRASLPEASLTLIGDGRERDRISRLAESLAVSSALDLPGRLSEKAKIEALDRADVLIGTSVREGWGLTVTEAAARGIPAVLYDVHGFRDAVVPGRTGLLVEPTPSALAAGVAQVVSDETAYRRLQRNAWLSVHSLTHEATANVFEHALAEVAANAG